MKIPIENHPEIVYDNKIRPDQKDKNIIIQKA